VGSFFTASASCTLRHAIGTLWIVLRTPSMCSAWAALASVIGDHEKKSLVIAGVAVRSHALGGCVFRLSRLRAYGLLYRWKAKVSVDYLVRPPVINDK